MEFWGIEVKPGESAICDPGKETYLHISQAALGETKKASENVVLYSKVNDQKLVLGTLSGDKFPQASFDLVFEKEFLLSHSSKSASVFVCGYKSAMADPESDGFSGTDSESESEPEPIQLAPKANGKIVAKEQAKAGKPTTGKASDKGEPSAKAKSKAEAKSEKPKPEEVDDDDDDDSEDDDESDDDSDSDDEVMPDAGDDSDDDDDEDDSDSSDEEDVTPKKAEVGKKRAGDSSTKSSVPEKKAKLVTPATKKSDGDGKKGSHTATPYPKQTGKNAANNEKSKQQTPKSNTPKSGGAVSCKSCSKTFNSESALQAHSKAKHEAK